MKEIKVYMQFPWKFGDSNYYKYLLEYPPEKIEYISNIKHLGNITSKKKFKINDFIKQNIKKVLRWTYPSIPNAHLTRCNKSYDLIHCAHCLSLNKNKPWICDIEYPGQFWAAPRRKGVYPNKKRVYKILKSTHCKKILSWTEWGKKEILRLFPELENKIEVMHYALPIRNISKKKKDKINLTFISRRFYFKGGLHAVEIIDRLTKKYNEVEGIIVSDIPKEILDRYSKNKKIKFYDILPYEKIMNEIFPKTDIFIYPSYTDTYGFLVVEAQSFGIPVITVGGQSREELVKKNVAGFIIKEPKKWHVNNLLEIETLKDIISEMEEKTELLINDQKLREKMGAAGLKEVKDGKFSIKKRNERLYRIYLESLEN